MADYRFTSEWIVSAPVNRVWAEVEDPVRWADWWPGLERVHQRAGASDARGDAIYEFTFKSFLPYTLSMEAVLTEVDSERRLVIDTVGELKGRAVYEIESLGESSSRVRLIWTVRTTKAWMNALAPLARGVFAYNHDLLMRAASDGFGRHIGAAVTRTNGSTTTPARMLSPLLGLLAVWLVLRAIRRHPR